MEQRQEMMDDAIDDAMDVGVEEEGDEVVEQVLEEIGVDLSQAVRMPASLTVYSIVANTCLSLGKHPLDYSRMLSPKLRLLKLWAQAEAETEATRVLTIYKRGWIVCVDDPKPDARLLQRFRITFRSSRSPPP